ncbi:MAG: glycosyltransferase family 4 protein [Candidatus Nanopelagicales bacterium]
MRIAHVTAHVGGGVGSVLRSFFEITQHLGVTNELLCLDRCETNFSDLTAIAAKRDGLAFDSTWSIKDSAQENDIILIHYWNHPLMAKFLADTKFPPTHLIAWTHNSGLFEPHIIPSYLAEIAEKILFTTACSFSAPNLQTTIAAEVEKFDTVHSTHVLDDFHLIGHDRKRRKHLEKLLYVGTVSDSKMHPKTAEIFSRLSQDGYSIKVVGGPDHFKLADRVSLLGGQIEVFGRVSVVNEFYKDADAFIYPLRKEHYGTGEQVILEAMAAGLPVIAFSNPAEEAVLRGGGGLLVDSENQFFDALHKLSTDTNLYQQLARAGRARASSEFDAKKMASDLLEQFRKVARHPKIAPFSPILQSKKLNLAELYALNSFFDGVEIINNNETESEISSATALPKIKALLGRESDPERWFDRSKSTPFHYAKYFPESAEIALLCEQMAD